MLWRIRQFGVTESFPVTESQAKRIIEKHYGKGSFAQKAKEANLATSYGLTFGEYATSGFFTLYWI